MKLTLNSKGFKIEAKAIIPKEGVDNLGVEISSPGFDFESEVDVDELKEINRHQEAINAAVRTAIGTCFEKLPVVIREVGEAIIDTKRKVEEMDLELSKAREEMQTKKAA